MTKEIHLMNNDRILLESGTNEVEILEFTIGQNHYGINVAKIKEITQYEKVTPVPNSHENVEGIFMSRGTTVTVIDLRNCLIHEKSEPKGFFIITNFNKLDVAFHVDNVIGIHRVSWDKIISPNHMVIEESSAIGIIEIKEEIIMILDFEKVVADINPETGLKVHSIEELGERKRSSIPILIAEDSPLLNKLIADTLVKAGYVNLTHTSNGQEAYDVIETALKEKELSEKVQCVITDIEMPVMDGHRLTKMIKENEKTQDIPVVIFSSLVNDEMRAKGEKLGANAQISKPEIKTLVQVLDKLLHTQE